MNIKLAQSLIQIKSIEIALEFFKKTLKKHCNIKVNIIQNGLPDLIIEKKPYKQKDSISEPAGYSFTPSKNSTPALLEGESSPGITGGIIYLGEYFAINGKYPGLIKREPIFDLRLASAVSPLYVSDIDAVKRALRSDKALQIWDSWTGQIDTNYPPYVDESAFTKRIDQFAGYVDQIVRYGANGIVMGGMHHMINYERLEKRYLLPLDSSIKLRHRVYYDFFKKIFGLVKERDLILIVSADQFAFLKKIESWIGLITADNPRVWETLTAGIMELFDRFPEIDGIMTRYGQHDEMQDYGSMDVFYSKGKRVDTHTWGDYENRPHDIQAVAKLVETVTKTCLEKDKLSIFRTWTQTEIDLHSRRDLYLQLIEAIPGEIKANTIFSIKRTLTDFWYYQPLNPTLRSSNSSRMIEFECRHQFEGMGIFPTYWGEDNQRAIKYAVGQNVRHIWFWPGAGGWVTPGYPVILPYVSGFDFWIDANVFQIYRLITDPDENGEKTASDFGILKLGRKGGEKIGGILKMAYQACSRIFYTLPYAQIVKWKCQSPCWHMPWLGVDPKEINRVLEVTGKAITTLIEESRKGVDWSIRLEQETSLLIPENDRDIEIVKKIKKSAYDLRQFAELMHSFRILFSTDSKDREKLADSLANYKKTLSNYKKNSNQAITDGFEKYLSQIEKEFTE